MGPDNKATGNRDVVKCMSVVFVTLFCAAVYGGCRFDGGGISGSTSSVCGNGIKETGEVCDGSDLGGEICETLGLGPGVLSCRTDCRGYYTAGCGAITSCGDGVIQGTEICDGQALDGATCSSLGYGLGDLGCAPDCSSFDVSQCKQLDGGPCTQSSDCVGGICWKESGEGNFPGGFCTSDCSGSGCEGGSCYEVSPGFRCYPTCGSSAECREGYACFDEWGTGETLCRPHCETSAQCPVEGLCNLYTGRCQSAVTGARNGEAPSDSCMGGWFLEAPDSTPYCVSLCALSTGICPEDDVCTDYYDGTRGDLGLCLAGCSGPNDCPRPGYTCKANPFGSGQICWP